MKTPTSPNKNKSENSQSGEYKNNEDKIIYLDSMDSEVVIWYDISKQSRYIQINNIK